MMQPTNTGLEKRRPILKIFGIIVLCMLLLAGGTAWWGWNQVQAMMEPVSNEDVQILVTIPRGASSAAIGDILEDKGLIHNSTLFRVWLRYYELDGRIQAGDYILSPSLDLNEVVNKLVRGDVHRETIRFTIPEGLFITDIAARLAEQEVVDEERFLELAANLDLWQDYWFVEQIPEGLEHPLEGYLFPDTYEIFAVSENREELVIALMLRRFDQIFTQDMRNQAEEMGMTVHEVMTLASIVEKEAVVAHERPTIAGVFHNRLDQSIPLGSCATVNYILGDFTIRYLTTEQTRIESPYNTYINRGLPPGPISGSGRSAIEATLWPEETDYLFFLAKDDGSGEHYFGRTNAEHEANRVKARQNRNR